MFYKFTVLTALGVIVAGMLSFAYWGLFNRSPYTVDILLSRDVVYAGQQVELQTVITGGPATCHAFLELYYSDYLDINKIMIGTSSRILSGPIITHANVRIPNFPDGTYKYNTLVAYYCDPYDRLFGPEVVRSEHVFTVLTNNEPAQREDEVPEPPVIRVP